MLQAEPDEDLFADLETEATDLEQLVAAWSSAPCCGVPTTRATLS